jgi:hypothetical protein
MSGSSAVESLRMDFGMARSYSGGLRARPIAIVEGGTSRHELAMRFEVSYKCGCQLAPALGAMMASPQRRGVAEASRH